jgi:hypothetical protein
VQQDDKEAAYVRKIARLYESHKLRGLAGEMKTASWTLLNKELELTVDYKFDGQLSGDKVKDFSWCKRIF